MTRAAAVFGGDAAADEFPKTVVIARNCILKVPIRVFTRIIRRATHYAAVVRHFQTEKCSGVRIETRKKKESVQKSEVAMWTRWQGRKLKSKKTPRQPRHELFFLLLLFSSFHFLLRQKRERSFSFEHLFETDFLLNIQSASKSWNSITRSDIKKTLLRTVVLPRFTTLPPLLNYLI